MTMRFAENHYKSQGDKYPLSMDQPERRNENDHVIDIRRGLEASSSGSAHDRISNELDSTRPEDRPLSSNRASVSQLSLPLSNISSSRNSSSRRGNGHSRRRRSPLNSGLWISVELALTLGQIVASVIVLCLSRHEHPQTPLFAWIVGYATGCVLTLPLLYCVNNEQCATPIMPMPTFKRSPSRRTKSRWEPLPEDKAIEKSVSTYQDSARQGLWAHFNGRDHKPVVGKTDRKDAAFSRLSTVEQTSASRSAHRPSKRQRFSNDLSATENGDASSDSDKEQSLTAYYSGAVTLANSPEERKRRENRSKRFEKGNGQRAENRFRPKNTSVGNLYIRRATALVLSKSFEDGGSRAVEDIDWDALTVKGTCQEIEKRYLRLTSAPDPSTVRPEDVLEKALLMVQKSQRNYLYKCDQLKSIRQDLTVQRIRNELTVKVYETHARLALEFGDLAEFNQSQSQLKSLYGEGIPGCHLEFSAYNLLSVSLLSNNRRDLLSLMSRLSDEAKRHEAVKHALLVRSAVTSGNYVVFFRLYKSAPNLNTCLMDLVVEKMRFEAVKCMSRTYRPTIPVSYVAQVLGFSSTSDGEGGDEGDVDGLEECTEWLKAHGACLIADNSGETMVDAKVSSSSLYMPEPEDAVAHGDANLAVNDFFTRSST